MSGFMTAFAINMCREVARSIWVKLLLFIYLFPQLMQVAKSVPRGTPSVKGRKKYYLKLVN